MHSCAGVVAAAPCDWTQSELLPVFSCAAVVLGVTTSALGEWVEKSGPRLSGMVGSCFWSAALLTTAAGVETHSLPLVYLGYGVLGGVGWVSVHIVATAQTHSFISYTCNLTQSLLFSQGLMYLTPVTAAMKWVSVTHSANLTLLFSNNTCSASVSSQIKEVSRRELH